MNYYVYILRSEANHDRIYIGYTTNLKNRLNDHSDPEASAYTRQYSPWKVETYTVFTNKQTAQEFEIYLKSQSGRAFLRKRMIV